MSYCVRSHSVLPGSFSEKILTPTPSLLREVPSSQEDWDGGDLKLLLVTFLPVCWGEGQGKEGAHC